MVKIIAVDDDERILRLIKKMLPQYQVETYSNALEIELESLNQYDLMLLDVMMPEIDGFAFCQQIREQFYQSIIFLTAKSDEGSLLEGLQLGADDYLTKPFSIKELSARIAAHLRSDNRRATRDRHFVVSNQIRLNFDTYQVFVEELELHLTKTQYLICQTLVTHRGQVMSKEHIFDQVFPLESESQLATVAEHIRVIRKKFQEVGVNPIETVWGVGYVWQE